MQSDFFITFNRKIIKIYEYTFTYFINERGEKS